MPTGMTPAAPQMFVCFCAYLCRVQTQCESATNSDLTQNALDAWSSPCNAKANHLVGTGLPAPFIDKCWSIKLICIKKSIDRKTRKPVRESTKSTAGLRVARCYFFNFRIIPHAPSLRIFQKMKATVRSALRDFSRACQDRRSDRNLAVRVKHRAVQGQRRDALGRDQPENTPAAGRAVPSLRHCSSPMHLRGTPLVWRSTKKQQPQRIGVVRFGCHQAHQYQQA